MAPARYATTPVHAIITLMYGSVPVRIGAGGATVLDPLAEAPPPSRGRTSATS